METLEGKGRASRAAVEGRARRKQLCSYKHSIAALNDEEIVYFGTILMIKTCFGTKLMIKT